MYHADKKCLRVWWFSFPPAALDESQTNNVHNSLKKKELQLHCRRETRGAEETKRMIKELLTPFDFPAERDNLGVPLLNSDKIWEMWDSKSPHMECVQDPKGYPMYTKTGSRMKGSITDRYSVCLTLTI